MRPPSGSDERPAEHFPSDTRPGNGRGLCGLCRTHLHRFVEDEIEPVLANALREHLQVCASCSQLRADLEAERLWLVESLLVHPPLSTRLAKKVIRRLRSEGAGRARRRPAGSAAGARERRGRRLAALLRTPLGMGTAAAACLALAFLAGHGASLRRGSGPGTPSDPAPGAVVNARPAAGVQTQTPIVTTGEMAARPSGEGPAPAAPRSPAAPAAGSEARRSAEAPGIQLAASSAAGGATAAGTVAAGAPAPAVLRRVSMADVIGIASNLEPAHDAGRRAPHGRRPPGGGVEADPCAPDPNKDGKTDINDVAYSCQVLMAGLAGSPPAALAPASLHVPDAAEGSPSEADCLDEHCVRT